MAAILSQYKIYQKGLFASIIVAIVAIFISKMINFSTATLAIILGMIAGNLLYKVFHGKDSLYQKGIKFAEKDLLMFAIALMGINLNFTMLASLGVKTIFMIIFAMAFTIFMGKTLGRFFGLNKKLSLMLGIGNAVCGSSAIAATSSIAKVENSDIAISIVLVNLMGTIGIFLAPFLAMQLGFSDMEGGVLAGNTLQAVGQAVAAGFSISDEAGHYATVVKMGRVLMIAPVVFMLIYLAKKESEKSGEVNEEKTKVPFPKFILWFLLFSALASLQILPKEIESIISTLSHYITLIAMSAIGLMIHFETVIKTGGVAFKVSLILFMMQLTLSSVLIMVL